MAFFFTFWGLSGKRKSPAGARRDEHRRLDA